MTLPLFLWHGLVDSEQPLKVKKALRFAHLLRAS